MAAMEALVVHLRNSPITYMLVGLVPLQFYFLDELLEAKRDRIRALAREVTNTV